MPRINHHIGHDVRHQGPSGGGGYFRHRRDWSTDEKLAIVAESFATTTSISAVACRHGLNRNQLFAWRRQFRDGELAARCEAAAFVPVTVAAAADVPCRAAAPGLPETDGVRSIAVAPAEVIEIVIGGMTVRVPPSADEASLRRVLAVVGGLR